MGQVYVKRMLQLDLKKWKTNIHIKLYEYTKNINDNNALA